MRRPGVHVYSAPEQPLTRYRDPALPGHWFGMPKNALVWCMKCRKRRRARNAVIQVYYDTSYIWCAPDTGGCR